MMRSSGISIHLLSSPGQDSDKVQVFSLLNMCHTILLHKLCNMSKSKAMCNITCVTKKQHVCNKGPLSEIVCKKGKYE